jgi:hypothetical protein
LRSTEPPYEDGGALTLLSRRSSRGTERYPGGFAAFGAASFGTLRVSGTARRDGDVGDDV